MAIEKVIYFYDGDSHTNEERIVSTVINGDVPDFIPRQIRVLKILKNGELGGHWRDYPEIYGFIGEAKMNLEDIDTKEKREYLLKTGSRIFIPSRVALKIYANEGTVIITCSASIGRDLQTHKYKLN